MIPIENIYHAFDYFGMRLTLTEYARLRDAGVIPSEHGSVSFLAGGPRGRWTLEEGTAHAIMMDTSRSGSNNQKAEIFADGTANINGTSQYGYGFVQGSSSVTATLAINASGVLYGWGSNTYGQTARGTLTGSTTTPTIIPHPLGLKWVTCKVSFQAAMCIDELGKVYGWGNYIGSGTGAGSGYSFTPTLLTFSNSNPVADINCANKAASNTCSFHAVTASGELWGWGNNESGKLGNGGSAQSLTPIRIGSDTDWHKTYTGYIGMFATKTNGSMYYAGAGGATNASNTFVRVGNEVDWDWAGNFGPTNTMAIFKKKEGAIYIKGTITNYGMGGRTFYSSNGGLAYVGRINPTAKIASYGHSTGSPWTAYIYW